MYVTIITYLNLSGVDPEVVRALYEKTEILLAARISINNYLLVLHILYIIY